MRPAGAALALIVRGYQLLLRPVMPPACRFEPSCSAYAIEALRTHGALRGLALASWRVLRCNPWGAGGYDPVPALPGEHNTTRRDGALSTRRDGALSTRRDGALSTYWDGALPPCRHGNHLPPRHGDLLNRVKAS